MLLDRRSVNACSGRGKEMKRGKRWEGREKRRGKERRVNTPWQLPVLQIHVRCTE